MKDFMKIMNHFFYRVHSQKFNTFCTFSVYWRIITLQSMIDIRFHNHILALKGNLAILHLEYV